MKTDELHERLMKHFKKIWRLQRVNKNPDLARLIVMLDDDYDELCEAINAVVYPDCGEVSSLFVGS